MNDRFIYKLTENFQFWSSGRALSSQKVGSKGRRGGWVVRVVEVVGIDRIVR